MQTDPREESEETTRLNSFHDHFDRVLRPLFGKTQNFFKIENFHTSLSTQNEIFHSTLAIGRRHRKTLTAKQSPKERLERQM